MVLIIGGRGQGKCAIAKSYASPEKSLLHLENVVARVYFPDSAASCPEQMDACDSNTAAPEDDWNRLREKAIETVHRLRTERSIDVITADEIGSGIVPMDRREREYRDTYGKICQELAREADKVVRVVCGIPTEIKG